MNTKVCAAPDLVSVDFKTAEKSVKKLQRRIAEAYSRRCFDKVDYLQHLLMQSYYAKVLAVSIVGSSRGRYTIGVDGRAFEDTLYTNYSYKQRNFIPAPLRRIYVPTGSGRTRPISIPTVTDQITQTLYKLSLEPIAELMVDECSFGFRKNRSSQGAIIRGMDILLYKPEMK